MTSPRLLMNNFLLVVFLDICSSNVGIVSILVQTSGNDPDRSRRAAHIMRKNLRNRYFAWSGVEVLWKANTWKTDEKYTRITFSMKMDAARPSETLVRICPVTRHFIPEDITLNIKRFVKLNVDSTDESRVAVISGVARSGSTDRVN